MRERTEQHTTLNVLEALLLLRLLAAFMTPNAKELEAARSEPNGGKTEGKTCQLKCETDAA